MGLLGNYLSGGKGGSVVGSLISNHKKKNTGSSKQSDVGDAGDAGSFKKGGKVKKTGLAKVHKGERVLTKKQNKRYMKSRGK